MLCYIGSSNSEQIDSCSLEQLRFLRKLNRAECPTSYKCEGLPLTGKYITSVPCQLLLTSLVKVQNQ